MNEKKKDSILSIAASLLCIAVAHFFEKAGLCVYKILSRRG